MMKALLAFALILNVALAGWIGFELKRPREIAVSEQSTPISTSALPASLRGKRAQTKTVVVTNTTQFAWRKIEAKDFKTYMANLRAMGCPEETVHDIILSAVERVYAPRLAAFRKPPEEFQFWKTGNSVYSNTQLTADEQKQYRDVNKEKEALLKELLGDDYRKDIMRQSPYGYGWTEDPFLEGLSKEKKNALESIQNEFNEKRSEIYRKAKGYTTPEDQDEIKRIDRDLHEALGKALSPQELFEYEVRTSQLANNMKYNELRGFDPTEQEFRALFKAKQETELMNKSENRTEVAAARAGSAAIRDELRTALGEDRYREYERSKDYEYQNLLRLTESRDLPREAADKVYQLKEEVQKTTAEIRRNQQMTEEQRMAALQTLRADAEKIAVETLGDRNFNAYKRNASWLRNLNTQPVIRTRSATRAP